MNFQSVNQAVDRVREHANTGVTYTEAQSGVQGKTRGLVRLKGQERGFRRAKQ